MVKKESAIWQPQFNGLLYNAAAGKSASESTEDGTTWPLLREHLRSYLALNLSQKDIRRQAQHIPQPALAIKKYNTRN